MTIKVNIEINRIFEVGADLNRVFDLLADVPESASHFPRVDALIDLGGNCFRWEMKKIGVEKHAIQSIYACRYVSSPEDAKIVWTPIKGEGNGVVEGSWQFTELEAGVSCRFSTNAQLNLPLPSLLKMAVSPMVKREFNSLVDNYISNLQKVLS